MMTVQDRYLDLVKKTLSFTLWPEPPYAVDPNSYRAPVKRLIVKTAKTVLEKGNFLLAKRSPATEEQRLGGEIWPSYADTMIGMKRLDNLQSCVETVIKENIPGDLIETGVWRGGACILMRAILAAYGVKDRRVFVADSFEGLPPPDAEKYPHDKGDVHSTFSFLAVSIDQVKNNFSRFGFPVDDDPQVVFLKGWFKDTIPTAPIDKLAILRLDGDMYESTIEVLEALYDKLSGGGFCIIDDYSLPPCKRAVEDFRSKHGITAPLQTIDYTGQFWRKP
jgi:O-methyltransferase